MANSRHRWTCLLEESNSYILWNDIFHNFTFTSAINTARFSLLPLLLAEIRIVSNFHDLLRVRRQLDLVGDLPARRLARAQLHEEVHQLVKFLMHPVAQEVNQERGDDWLAVAEPHGQKESFSRELDRQDGWDQDQEVEGAPGDGLHDGHHEQGSWKVLVRYQEEPDDPAWLPVDFQAAEAWAGVAFGLSDAFDGVVGRVFGAILVVCFFLFFFFVVVSQHVAAQVLPERELEQSRIHSDIVCGSRLSF